MRITIAQSLACAMILALAVCVPTGAAQSTTKSSSKVPSSKTQSSKAHRTSYSKKTAVKAKARDHGQKAPTPERITEIQQALAKDGSFNAIPNGKWDDSTVDAMKKFQANHGLSASGRLDAPTLQKLGMGSETAGIAAPTPPPGSASRLISPAQAIHRQ